MAARPLEQVRGTRQTEASAHWRSSKSSTHAALRRRAARRRARQAPKSSSWSRRRRGRSRPSRWASRGSSHARSSASGDVLVERGVQLRERRVAAPPPRRSAPACAPSRRAPSRPRLRRRRGSGRGASTTSSTSPSTYFSNSQREPRLADAGDADDRHELRAPLLGRRVEQLLDEAELAVAADERRLEALRRAARPPRAAVTRTARHSVIRLGLALERVRAGLLVRDRRLGRTLRRLADEHRPRLGRRLDARGGVDEIARDHALPLRAEGDGRLAGQHAGTRLEPRVELGHRGDEVERGAHCPLGVVLLRDRRPPHRHDGVADELLDRAAVALDQRSRRLEVARQQLARLLRVAALGRGREPDEVREQHRHEPALGGGLDGRPAQAPRSARSRTRRRTSRSGRSPRRMPGRAARAGCRTRRRTCGRPRSRSRRPGSASGPDVLVQPEHVLRIPFPLERHQTLLLGVAVDGARVLSLLCDVVDVAADDGDAGDVRDEAAAPLAGGLVQRPRPPTAPRRRPSTRRRGR